MSRNIEGAIGDKYEKFFPGDKSSRVEHGKKAEIQVGESFENFAIETEEGTLFYLFSENEPQRGLHAEERVPEIKITEAEKDRMGGGDFEFLIGNTKIHIDVTTDGINYARSLKTFEQQCRDNREYEVQSIPTIPVHVPHELIPNKRDSKEKIQMKQTELVLYILRSIFEEIKNQEEKGNLFNVNSEAIAKTFTNCLESFNVKKETELLLLEIIGFAYLAEKAKYKKGRKAA